MTLVLDQGESNIVLITIEYINNWEKTKFNTAYHTEPPKIKYFGASLHQGNL